jgi:hypothetical protein
MVDAVAIPDTPCGEDRYAVGDYTFLVRVSTWLGDLSDRGTNAEGQWTRAQLASITRS